MLPVVKARAFDLTFVEREAEWFDEVQGGPGRKAGSPSVASVPMDLGVDQYDVRCQLSVGVRVRVACSDLTRELIHI
jgi:hypothetical protein